MKVFLAGQKWFGYQVFESLSALGGVTVSGVSAPYDDRLYDAAAKAGCAMVEAGNLKASTLPEGIDLIVAAHSHDFVGEATRNRAGYGAIGYHPSLLPLHRGRDAIRWAIRMGEPVTGGTVYRLSNKMDGGRVLDQRHVFIRPDDTARSLWERDLAPLGVRMITEAVSRFQEYGFMAGTEQDEALATWEPSFGSPPAFRPDLIMLPPYVVPRKAT